MEQKEGAASLCIFLYLCTDGWASAIRARVCIHSAINVECGVLLGDAADVELTLFTRMKLQRFSLISISCHLGWDGVRGGLAEDCGAAVNRKRVKVSESSHTPIVMIFIT